MIFLKIIGLTCLDIVLINHVPMEWWEGALIGFGAMLFFGDYK